MFTFVPSSTCCDLGGDVGISGIFLSLCCIIMFILSLDTNNILKDNNRLIKNQQNLFMLFGIVISGY